LKNDELKNIPEIFYLLRSRISDYRKDNYEMAHPAIKFDINSVEIALNLAEIYFYYRNLTDKELEWFKGKRFITETFQNDWKDIADNYLLMAEFVKKGKINRK